MPNYGSGARRIYASSGAPDWVERSNQSNRRSPHVSPAKGPGRGAYVPNHLVEHYQRRTHVSSASPLVLMVVMHQQSKGGDS
jgi:hypothetical protein